MTAIRIVCLIHILWGLCLIFMPEVPRPFGALEPYLEFAPPVYVGLALFVSGVLPFVPMQFQWFRCVLCFTLPQQAMLVWALFISLSDVARHYDARALLAICYLLPIVLMHFFAMMRLSAATFPGRSRDTGS